MSAQPGALPAAPRPRWHRFAPMRATDLDAIASIEASAYEFPWSRGNFEDALKHRYLGICLRDDADVLLGYCILMPVVDEMHLLNLCIAPSAQGQGAGAALLAEALRISRELGFLGMLLEVRPSNLRAIGLYERRGFMPIGRRKNYYPARERRREDAVVMRLTFLPEKTHAGH